MSPVRENSNCNPSDQQLDELAKLIDSSCDCGNVDGLRDALVSIDIYLAANPDPQSVALLQYFAANAWSGIRRSVHKRDAATWDWQQPELEKEVLCLRTSIQSPGFASLHDVRRCQVFTNLGNTLSTIGRFIEAIEYWNRALAVVPTFAMALGNRGEAFLNFSQAVYDIHHRHILLRQAVLDLRSGLHQGVDGGPGEHFRRLETTITAKLGEKYIQDGDDLTGFSLGKSAAERVYRSWCLRHTLFMNPLNDLGEFPIAACDVFSSPSVVVRTKRGPSHHGFFNQLKQEYVSARFLFFEGSTATKPHFSDREVLLHDTMDYPAYSLAVEKMKLSFRSTYSLFDKVAFFINDYFGLEVSERSINFRTIWFNKQCESKGLRPEFERLENWPMRGLYWLSKDLYFKQGDASEAMEPDAQSLRIIRNHAEHKYLKIHDSWRSDISQPSDEFDLKDKLAYSIYRDDFVAKTLRLLKIARAAMMYLSLGVHWEERRRKSEQPENTVTIPLPLYTVRDIDKR